MILSDGGKKTKDNYIFLVNVVCSTYPQYCRKQINKSSSKKIPSWNTKKVFQMYNIYLK